MKRKPLTARSATLISLALTGGSTAGAVTDALATGHGYDLPGASQLVAGIVALWLLDKLHRLVEDTE